MANSDSIIVIQAFCQDNEVICDLCNAEISNEEGGSFVGSYSLCQACTKNVLADATMQDKEEMVIFEKNFRTEVLKKRIQDAEGFWENA